MGSCISSLSVDSEARPAEDPSQKLTLRLLGQRTLVFLASFIAIFLVFELMVRMLVYVGMPLRTCWPVYDVKYDYAVQPYENNKHSILLVGSSYSSYAFYTELLSLKLKEAGYNLDVRNLSSPGNNFKLSFFILKRAVEAGAKPRMVIVDVHPTIFDTKRKWESQDAFLKSYVGKCFFDKPGTIESQVSCYLQDKFYLARYRQYLKDLTVNFANAVYQVEKGQYRLNRKDTGVVEHETSPQGWVPAYRVMDRQTFDKRFARLRKWLLKGFKWDKQHWDFKATGYEEFVKYCQKHKIQVILVWLPQAYINESDHQYFSQKLELLAKEPYVDFLNLHKAETDISHFHDVSHLNILGAVKVTETLSNILSAEPYRTMLKQPYSATNLTSKASQP